MPKRILTPPDKALHPPSCPKSHKVSHLLFKITPHPLQPQFRSFFQSLLTPKNPIFSNTQLSEPMADYSRSKSYAHGYGGSGSSNYNDMQLQPYSASGQQQPPRYGDLNLRCYSGSYAQSQMDMWGGGGGYGYGSNNLGEQPNDSNMKKGKGWGGSGSGSKSMSWAVADPEFQRKKRVASYKMYAVEGKMKGSFRKSFRWLKDRYRQVVHGW